MNFDENESLQIEDGASLKQNEQNELSQPTEHAGKIHFLWLLRVVLSRCCATQDISQCSSDPNPPLQHAATQSATAATVLVPKSKAPISPEWSSMRRKTADSVSIKVQNLLTYHYSKWWWWGGAPSL